MQDARAGEALRWIFRCATAPRWWPSATPTAWSWPVTGVPPRETYRPPGYGEGLPRRSPFGGRHRRGCRSGCGDGQALPDPARALREGGGGLVEPGGQGEPARRRWCASTFPWPCRASWSSRSTLASTSPGRGANLHLRRNGRPLRGGRPRGDRVGWARRADHDQVGMARATSGVTRGSSSPCAPCTKRPTRTRPRAGPTWSAASSRWWPR